MTEQSNQKTDTKHSRQIWMFLSLPRGSVKIFVFKQTFTVERVLLALIISLLTEKIVENERMNHISQRLPCL
jgi:hypothetical protein